MSANGGRLMSQVGAIGEDFDDYDMMMKSEIDMSVNL